MPTTYSAIDDPSIEEVLATWRIRLTDEQTDWLIENAERLELHFADKLEFVKTRGGRFAVVVHQFARRFSDGGRFITECPHGDRHAAREVPRWRILDELPPDEVLYAPEPEHHRFDDE